MRTIIHVNQHVIKANRKNNRTDPPIIVKTYKGTKLTHIVKIDGPSSVIHSLDPLPCGAHVWIETQAPVTCS